MIRVKDPQQYNKTLNLELGRAHSLAWNTYQGLRSHGAEVYEDDIAEALESAYGYTPEKAEALVSRLAEVGAVETA